MFTPDDFKLPSGEEMTPEEIADMLNNWKNAPVRTQVERGALLPAIGQIQFPSYSRPRMDFTVPIEIGSPLDTVKTTVAFRRSGVFELIYDKVTSLYLLEGRKTPPYVILGFNLVYSLEVDAPENLRKGRYPTAINTPGGPINIVISSVPDRIEFGFDQLYDAY
jgi:hypothetical protein